MVMNKKSANAKCSIPTDEPQECCGDQQSATCLARLLLDRLRDVDRVVECTLLILEGTPCAERQLNVDEPEPDGLLQTLAHADAISCHLLKQASRVKELL